MHIARYYRLSTVLPTIDGLRYRVVSRRSHVASGERLSLNIHITCGHYL